MKNNIKNILSQGTAEQKCLIYFENLCINSIQEDKNGFLSDLEQVYLRKGLKESQEKRLFNKFLKTYECLTTAFDKLHILYFAFESTSKQYFWLNLLIHNQTLMLNAINELFFDWNANCNNKDLPKCEQQERLIFGTLKQMEDNFFEIIPYAKISLSEQLQLLRKMAIEDFIKVKSAVNAVENYMTKTGFDVKVYKEMFSNIEEESLKMAKAIDLNCEETPIDKKYSDWFSNYFLE